MPLPQTLALVEEIAELRRLYEIGTPRQRLSIALKRINSPEANASDLVTRVSAVEAFARCILAHTSTSTHEQVHLKYRKYAKREATSLVEGYLKLHAKTPQSTFGDEIWELFRLAVSTRNLIVHECTFLDAQKYLPMAHACTEVLLELSKISRTRTPKSAA